MSINFQMMKYEFIIRVKLPGHIDIIIPIKVFGTPELLNTLNLHNIMAPPKIIYETQGEMYITAHRHPCGIYGEQLK